MCTFCAEGLVQVAIPGVQAFREANPQRKVVKSWVESKVKAIARHKGTFWMLNPESPPAAQAAPAADDAGQPGSQAVEETPAPPTQPDPDTEAPSQGLSQGAALPDMSCYGFWHMFSCTGLSHLACPLPI